MPGAGPKNIRCTSRNGARQGKGWQLCFPFSYSSCFLLGMAVDVLDFRAPHLANPSAKPAPGLGIGYRAPDMRSAFRAPVGRCARIRSPRFAQGMDCVPNGGWRRPSEAAPGMCMTGARIASGNPGARKTLAKCPPKTCAERALAMD